MPLLQNWIKCGPELAYECLLEQKANRAYTVFMFIWYFLVEIVSGLAMLYVVKYNISRTEPIVPSKDGTIELERKELLRKKIMLFLGAWLFSSCMTVISHACNMFTHGQIFPFGCLVRMILTEDVSISHHSIFLLRKIFSRRWFSIAAP